MKTFGEQCDEIAMRVIRSVLHGFTAFCIVYGAVKGITKALPKESHTITLNERTK